MHPNLTKALFLSCLLTVAFSCEAAPGELNATATLPPCNGLNGAAECRIAYQQPELELVAGLNDAVYQTLYRGQAACDRIGARYSCAPPPNSPPKCDMYNRHC
ncbi:hypothetical protein BT93_L3686 [Corymbia citriodora subsp. variegata]|uniref:Uncharacterized protein n=1 Tax=Corymbia citriodora subsp. variegata TaxID=360336 RepID=A0A8T0CGU8_CORYI|nr:hypothetical protein BT93_L3686 [Corymbia citriodora subsp. variegata]